MSISKVEENTIQNLPHHLGHRDRLRARFLKNGADALADYELLELLLFMAIPRRDVKPLAKQLLAQFGSLHGVFQAPIEELLHVKGLSETSVSAIKIVSASALVMMRQDVSKKPVLSTWPRLIDYIHASMAHEKKEHFRVLFLNKKNELIADEIQNSGTVDHAPVYPREIMKRALEHAATALILVHNHPSGDPNPSRADIDVTNLLVEAAKVFNITIHDHIIIARGAHVSLRNKGYL